MRGLLSGLAILFVAMIGSAEAHLLPNAPAPDFAGTTAEGKTINLSDFTGRPVILEWTNHDCPFVIKHYETGNMQRTQRALTEKGAVWISIISSAPGHQGNVSGDQALEIAAARASYADHIILDPEGRIGRLYDARTTPQMVLVSAQGALLYMGAIDDRPSARPESVEGAKNYLLAAYEAMAAGKPVLEPVTRPYGCSVKYGD